MDVKTDFVDYLCNEKKMCLLAYVTDIFGELNASMQGGKKNIIQIEIRLTVILAQLTCR